MCAVLEYDTVLQEGARCDFPHVFCKYYPREGCSPSKHRQCICGVRASLEPHRTHVDGVKKKILADLGRKKKRGVGCPYFSHGGSRRRVFFYFKFWCGLDHTTFYIQYAYVHQPQLRLHHPACSVLYCMYSTVLYVQHCTLCVAVRADGHQEAKMRVR